MVVWAAVLVPMWLRRHDAITESRSVDRFSTAMRVLSRRPPHGAGSRYVVLPPAAPEVQERRVPGLPRFPTLRATSGRSGRRDARAQLRERRARVLVVLLGLAGLSFLLALAGVTGWSLQLLVDLLFIGYVVHLRLQVLKAAPIALRPPAAHRNPQPSSTAAYAEEPAVTRDVAEHVTAHASAGATVDRGWAPNPMPLPTYVTAPVVQRPVPSQRPQRGPAAEPFQPDHAEIEVLFERRWAVND